MYNLSSEMTDRIENLIEDLDNSTKLEIFTVKGLDSNGNKLVRSAEDLEFFEKSEKGCLTSLFGEADHSYSNGVFDAAWSNLKTELEEYYEEHEETPEWFKFNVMGFVRMVAFPMFFHKVWKEYVLANPEKEIEEDSMDRIFFDADVSKFLYSRPAAIGEEHWGSLGAWDAKADENGAMLSEKDLEGFKHDDETVIEIVRRSLHILLDELRSEYSRKHDDIFTAGEDGNIFETSDEATDAWENGEDKKWDLIFTNVEDSESMRLVFEEPEETELEERSHLEFEEHLLREVLGYDYDTASDITRKQNERMYSHYIGTYSQDEIGNLYAKMGEIAEQTSIVWTTTPALNLIPFKITPASWTNKLDSRLDKLFGEDWDHYSGYLCEDKSEELFERFRKILFNEMF